MVGGGPGASASPATPAAPHVDTPKLSTMPPPIVVDDDKPPAFPALDSPQRHPAEASQAMPPPRLAPSGLQSLRAPLSAPHLRHLDVPVARKKVVLEPGCSPLDWARLKQMTNLRGVTTLLRVTPSELRNHCTPNDAWTAIQGKVYNITPYLRFHPGGQDTLLRVAGRDGTRLFYLTHAWVNIDAILDTAMVGVYVPDS